MTVLLDPQHLRPCRCIVLPITMRRTDALQDPHIHAQPRTQLLPGWKVHACRNARDSGLWLSMTDYLLSFGRALALAMYI